MKLNVRAESVAVNVGDLMDVRGMTTIGNALVAIIRRRTGQGESYTGDAFAPYSTRPIYITRGRGTGARLAPKGGRLSRTGQSVYYAGGYAEYKQASTGSGVVNLTLSGQLMRSIAVAKATARQAIVQAGNGTADYARGVDTARPYMGASPAEVALLTRVANAEVKRVIRTAQAREGGQ